MQGFELDTILLTAVISLVVALAAIWVLSRSAQEHTKSAHSLMLESGAKTAFLFDDDVLVDASPEARRLLGPKTDNTSDWQRLISAFSSRFPTLAQDLSALGDAGSLTILPDNPHDPDRIEAEWWDGMARLELLKAEPEPEKGLIDNISLAALEDELETLRRTTRLAPYLVWQENRDGKITWANAAYLALAKTVRPENNNNSWPPERLFNLISEASNTPDAKSRRVSVSSGKNSDPLWYDLSCKKTNESTLCFAVSADAVVRAENSLNEFVQTLTKTFAHLSIGLAIFDKNRQLALFNPALTDLTKLPIDFLSARPTLYSLLDRLRENQMMPEPKDYKSWRQQMTALEQAAADGTYEEIWTLPNGQTYRVNGRPHPDGAVALLFEDISAEISLTRNFRQELEVGQSVLDAFDEAVVVFSSSGLITMSNAAYTDLWGVDPGTSFGEMSVIDATRCWQDICDPTPLWEDLRNFVTDTNERIKWVGEATLDDGRALACHVTPLSGGATMVMFRVSSTAKNPGKKRRNSRKSPANT